MHARIVRFTDVTPDAIDSIVNRVEESGGPPEGVESTGMELFYDESQGTAVFVGYFADAEKLNAANEIFDSMDASDTPGNRQSVDLCEIKLQESV